MPFDDLEFSGVCERCERHPAVVRTSAGDVICTPCAENDQQDAYDRQQEQDFAAYHGGNSPFNDAERAAVQGRRR